MSGHPTQPGPGRPKGTQSEHTKLMVKAKQKFNARASKLAMRLLSSQAIIALGTHTLMRLDPLTKKATVVRDDKEIEAVFNEFANVDDSGIVNGKYYFITHGEPNNMAIESILNRVWGKAKESLDLTTGGEALNAPNKEEIDNAVMEYIMGKRPITITSKAPIVKERPKVLVSMIKKE